jgi:hypothetical protein
MVIALILESSTCSSPSSSCNSDSDDEATSLGHKKLDPIKFDKNVCPEGCEPQLYNVTLELRSQR